MSIGSVFMVIAICALVAAVLYDALGRTPPSRTEQAGYGFLNLLGRSSLLIVCAIALADRVTTFPLAIPKTTYEGLALVVPVLVVLMFLFLIVRLAGVIYWIVATDRFGPAFYKRDTE